MIWRKFFDRAPDQSQVLYEKIVKYARRERFYRDLGVPDTVDGRFEMIVLHLFLVLDRLKQEGQPYEDLQQRLTDAFFKDMDRSLREMGAGDLSVGKKVRKMAEACYGRFKAYKDAMAEGEASLQQALARNVYADTTPDNAAGLAKWMMSARNALQLQPTKTVAAGEFDLP
jgi:cytochrome b pre-mRNA-processing protein 3